MAGYITTASNYKEALLENERDIFGNRSWQSAYSDIDYNRQLAESQLTKQFGQDVGIAYQAAQQQRGAVLGSNLGSGFKEAALGDIDMALSQAYESSLASLSDSRMQLMSQAQGAYGNIDAMLAERSENMAALDKKHYDYLVELDKWYQENQAMAPEGATMSGYDEFKNSTLWSKFYYTDPATNTQRLMTYEELAVPRVDPVSGEYVSLYDENGNLTRVGRDYYDQLENFYAQRVTKPGEMTPPSFAGYLAQSDPELYEWANAYNPFSYSPTGTGISQNIGAFKQLVGLESADEQYSFLERFGGLSRTQVDNVFSDLYTALDKENLTLDDVTQGIGKFKDLAKELGFKNVDWEQVEQTTNTLLRERNAFASEKEGTTTGAIVAGATGVGLTALAIVLAATAAASYVNPFAPVTAPTAGTAAGAGAISASTAAGGSFMAMSNTADRARELTQAIENKELDIQDLYRTTIASMAAEVQREYTEQRIAEGGIYGAAATEQTRLNTAQSLTDWSNQTDVPMSEAEYNTYLAQVDKRSSNKLNYRTSGYTIGSDNTIKITIKTGGERYDVGLGEVANARAEQFLNRYATGNIDTSPERRTMVKVNNELYMYVKDGWRKVIPLAHDINNSLHGTTTYTIKGAEDYKRAYQDLLSAF